ncbi:MAG: polymerase sigma factor [Cytophagaceae bacterium]|nr:polymerase sigma factor [Cytophagaceae bacterium]
MEDSEIIALFKEDKTKHYGFNLLVTKYQKKVYWLTRKMVVDHDDANDLTQNVFIKVWKNLDRFREDASLYTWIYRIASNECLNFIKKKKNVLFIPIYDLTKDLHAKLDSSSLIDGDDISIRLQKAIITLPDKQRLVFNMKYFDELTYEEMSDVLGTSVGALKASYHHAVKKIEQHLKIHLNQ